MIIYKDRISGDELFTDAYKFETPEKYKGTIYKVKGKNVTRKEGEIDFGANPSAEEAAEGVDESCESGIDVVLDNRLVTSPFDKGSYKTYIKGYVQSIKKKLEEENSEEIKEFQEGTMVFIKEVIKEFQEFEFYLGNDMNADGMCVLLKWEENDPFFYFFKHGLIAEKV